MSNEKTNERWYKSENRLFHADTVTNKSTGEVVEISNSLEKLYAYMLNQYRYRSGREQSFAESQERLGTIARIGDPKKKTKPQIDKLIALGLVEITGKVGRCNIYKVIDVDKVAGNLEFSYPEWAGEPMYDHEKRLGKSSQQPKNEENKGDDESDQGDAEQRDGVPDIHSDQHDDIPPDDDAVNQDEIAIFDENNVVTEAFINGADNPRIGRNDDGTVQNYRYTYARAKTAQAFQDGKASPQAISDSWSIWFNAARPEYIPVHLLPVHERPVLAGYFDDDEEF